MEGRMDKKGQGRNGKGLSKLFNRIEEDIGSTRQRDQILIRSLYKKGPKEDLGNQRGIFPANTISKVF